MSKKIDTKEFIKRAKLKHGEHYDYSLSNYLNAKTKIMVRCKKHNIVCFVDPYAHFDHHSCKYCAIEQSVLKQSFTTEIFVKKAKEIHGDEYDYSKVDYINARTKVCIICSEHSEFYITPDCHIGKRKTKCNKCSYKLKGLKNTKTLKTFIEQCSKKHNNKYIYSKTVYKSDKEKVCIICPIHGEFWQSPTHHVQGKGCLQCARNSTKLYNCLNPIGWTLKKLEK